ncbi:MAG: hypothetical protein NVSMB57_03660 [Actinomycetota bacterium]
MRSIREARAEEGFTIVELTLASALMLIIVAAFLQTAISLANSDARAQAVANNAEDVRVVLNDLARDLRAANPLAPADSSGARTAPTANLLRVALGAAGSAQTYLEWKYDSAAKTLTRSVLTSPTRSPPSSVFRLSGLAFPAGVVPFHYYCSTAGEIDPTTTTAPNDIANLSTRVRVTIVAAPRPGPAPFTAQQDVELRNQPYGGTRC